MSNEPKFNFDKPAYEWRVFGNNDFSVLVRAWGRTDGTWTWNIYANLFDSHPLHGEPARAKELPFHWGCTYDSYITTEPSEGIKYDFQKVGKVLKVGNDYAHYQDDWAMCSDPQDGIPYRIQSDVRILIAELLEVTTCTVSDQS